MEIKPIHLEQYQAPNGEVPFRDWLNAIKDRKTKIMIQRRLERLASGNFGDR